MEQLQVQHLINLTIDSTCRTCLENLNEFHHNIFEIEDFPKKFTSCTTLSIKPNDGFPTNLCESCFTKIDDFYNFQLMCISAEIRFKEYINLEQKPSTSKFDQIIEGSKNAFPADNEPTKNECSSLYQNESLVSFEVELSTLENQPESQVEEEDSPAFKYEIDEDNDCSLKSYEGIDSNSPDSIVFTEAKHENEDLFDNECLESIQAESSLEGKAIESDIHLSDEDSDESSKPKPKELDKAKHLKVPEKNISCTESGCDKTTSSKRNLRKHITEAHNPKYFVCEECGKVLKGSENLKNHRFLHSGKPRPHKCPQCPKRFMTKYRLTDHMNRHNGIKNFECPECGVKKTSRIELRSHINYHTLTKTYPCDICERVFFTPLNLKRHNNVVHDGLRKYPCSYCDKSFGTLTSRNNHERIHTGERPHECNICNIKFITKGKLKQHIKEQHLNEGVMYPCDQCGKEFNNLVNLKRHQKVVHDGIKEYLCSHCDRSFGTAVTRNNHEKIHTDDRPYECKTCGKRFITYALLATHKLMHIGKKPHECDVCHNVYVSVSSLNRHKKNSHLKE
ncbi:zinc finger protein OZF-like [Episyrphus balteatus]|uniref:zinc finger protein OZF-like n=1 Tax=Episyrphus balteatus TaxID=286459 RepID=UPI002485463F|nr:zinc finger protein OZF-like [Episyrphus balteatus]